MRIGIIIPTYNRKKYLQKLANCIEAQQLPSGISVEVFVVIDGSTDGTFEMLQKEFSDYKTVMGSGNWWYTKSVNEGLIEAMKSKSTHFLLMNDDTEVRADFIEKLVKNYQEIAHKNPILGCIALTLEEPYRIVFSGIKDFIPWRWKSILYHQPFQQFPENGLTGLFESKFLTGRGMFFSRQIIEEVGYLDEKLIQYGSDEEFTVRARKKGFVSYISWETVIFSHHKLTGQGTNYMKDSFRQHLQGYFTPQSRNYWYKYWRCVRLYGSKWYFMLTLLIILLANTQSYFKNKIKRLDRI